MPLYRLSFGDEAVYVLADAEAQAIEVGMIWARQEFAIADPPRTVEQYVAPVARHLLRPENWLRLWR